MALREARRACVHCGICLSACPTYRVLREEADSPRGRLLLLDLLAEGRARADEVRGPLDRCIGCRACESACPSGVPYGELLEAGRARLGPPWRARLFLERLLPRPRLVGLLAAAARLVRRAPPAGPPRPWPAPPPGARGRVALHPGCVTPHLFPRLAAECAHVLARLGYRVEVPAGQACCGALHRHAGLDDAPLRETNARAHAGFDLAVSPAAGCSATPGLTDVCALLRREGPPSGARLPPARVAWDAPCHHLHAQGLDAGPLLDAIEGVTRVTLPSSSECCGAGGLYAGLQPALARAVRERKLDEIAASGATIVATANPGCLLWLWRGVRARGLAVEVAHPVSLLARALA